MPELILYHAPGACSNVTMNALEEVGLPFENRAINLFKGEQKTPEYIKLNPKGKVPALIVDGQLLTENASILMYIHKLKPEGGLLPVTDNAFDQARYFSDLIWCSAHIHPMVRQVLMPIRFTDGDAADVYKKGVEYLNELLPVIEDRVGGGRWWYGDEWSIVDVYLCWCCGIASLGKFDLEPYPAIQAHTERVKARPSYQRAWDRELAAAEGFNTPG